MYKALFFYLVLIIGCEDIQIESQISNSIPLEPSDTILFIPDGFIANIFNYPVGIPDGEGYYNAQGFGDNTHLGDDWNAVTGGNSDLGDPIYAVANGYIKFAEDNGPGWGNVIRMNHHLADSTIVESLYAHCDTIMVQSGVWITIGTQIGTIGNADGIYNAHLHFEMRNKINMPIGGGYSINTEGYIDPTFFIDEHRGR